MKLKSENSFLDFVKASPQAVKVGVLILIGLLLIFLCGFSGEKNTEAKGEEEKLSDMCSSMDGVGECRVMLTYKEIEGESQVYGVLVLCEGGESVVVKERITSVFCSIYGIGANRVEIGRLCK